LTGHNKLDDREPTQEEMDDVGTCQKSGKIVTIYTIEYQGYYKCENPDCKPPTSTVVVQKNLPEHM
jgi:hypothetical protein